MDKENFVGRLLLKRFFRDLLTKFLDDGKDNRSFLQFKKQKELDLNFPRFLLFHGENGLGKTTAIDKCIQITKQYCDETNKSVTIVCIDWEDWYYSKWNLPNTNIEMMNALYQLFSNKGNGISGHFSRFEELYEKIKRTTLRVNELIKNEWPRESPELESIDTPEQEQIRLWLQKKVPKQDLELFEKADTKLAEVLINGLKDASTETPVIMTIDNYEFIDTDTEKWFRTSFLNRITDFRLITIISGSSNFSKGYRNIFPEESLHIINFNDITLTKLDILNLAVRNHLSISESDAEKIETVTNGIPLVVKDIFNHLVKGIPLNEIISETCENSDPEKLISDITTRFLKYTTDFQTKQRVFHLIMLKQCNPSILSAIWQVTTSEVTTIINKLSDQLAFINNKKIHPLVRDSLTSYLQQEFQDKNDPELISVFDYFASASSQYFSQQIAQLEHTILSSEIRYNDERYCNALIGYYCGLLWSNPDRVFNSLPGTYIELVHFNVNFVMQLFWHIGQFRLILPENYTNTLDMLYNGFTLADQSLLSNRTPIQPNEDSVMSYLEEKMEEMNDFQRALFFHKKGELKIRQSDFSGAKQCFDNSFSLMDPTNSECEILYEDYILLGDEFSKLEEFEQVIAVIKNAVTICPENYLPWFDLGMAYSQLGDYQNASEAFSKSVSINPDYQDTWFYLGLSKAATDNHDQAVAAFFNAVEKGPQNSQIFYNMGVSLEKTEKLSEAIETYQKVVKLDPQNVDSWHRIGMLNSILGQSQEAIEAFTNTINIKPDFIEAYIALGDEYSKIGKFKNGAETFEKAAELDPNNADIWNSVAFTWFSAEQNQKAIDAAQKSIALKDDVCSPWVITGHAYTALSNFTEANKAYTKASELSPEDASVWVNLGNNFYAQSMYDQAIDAFNKAVSIDPEKEGTWFNLALAYRVKEQYDLALNAFEKAIKQEPSNPECWFQKGRIHMTLEQFKDASDSFSKTVELSPKSHDAWFKRGIACANCLDHQEAIKSFTKASELWSTDPDIWFNMGLSYAAIENFSEAVVSYKQATSLAPTRQEAWYNLGYSLQMLGEFQQATEPYLKSIEIQPDHFLSIYNSGVCYYYLGDYTHAQTALDSAISIQPDNADAILFLALTCHALERYEEAINYYSKVTEINPDSSDAWFNMALAYHAISNFDKVIEIYAIIVNKWPDNSSAWYNMGLVFHSRNQLIEAINAYRHATIISTNQPEIWFSLAAAYHAKEFYGDAIQAYRKVIKLSPDFIDAHFNLAMAYSIWGHHSDAIESYNKIVKLKPDYFEAWINLCISHFSIGQFDQALDAGLKANEIESDDLSVISYVLACCVLTGKITKAHEFADKLLASGNTEEINRTIYLLDQEIGKNPALQGVNEIMQKLQDIQINAMDISV